MRQRFGLLDIGLGIPAAEKALLHIGFLALHPVAVTYQRFKKGSFAAVRCKISAAGQVADTVEGSANGKVFERFSVDRLQVHTLHKIINRFEFTVALAAFDDILHGRLAYPFDRGQAEANVTLVIDRKTALTVIHIGPEHRQSHPLALIHEEADLLDIG